MEDVDSHHRTSANTASPLPLLPPPPKLHYSKGYTALQIGTISQNKPLPAGYTSVFWNRRQQAQINLCKFNFTRSTSLRCIGSWLGLSTFFVVIHRRRKKLNLFRILHLVDLISTNCGWEEAAIFRKLLSCPVSSSPTILCTPHQVQQEEKFADCSCVGFSLHFPRVLFSDYILGTKMSFKSKSKHPSKMLNWL